MNQTEECWYRWGVRFQRGEPCNNYFLDDVRTGTGEPDIIAFALASGIRVRERDVAGDERFVGFMEVDAGTVVMN